MMLILFSMLVGLAAETTTRVEGRVVDIHGHPLVLQRTDREALPAVTLSGCAGTRDAVRLDSSFAFDVPEGGCSLVISAPGYRSRTVAVTDPSAPLEIRLEPEVAPAAAVVIHRGGSARPARSTHQPRTIQVQPDGSMEASAPPASVQPSARPGPQAPADLLSALGGGAGSLEGLTGAGTPDLSALLSQLGGGDPDQLASLMSQLQSGDVDPAMLDGLLEGGVLDVHPGAAGAPANAPDLQQILQGLQKLQQALK